MTPQIKLFKTSLLQKLVNVVLWSGIYFIFMYFTGNSESRSLNKYLLTALFYGIGMSFLYNFTMRYFTKKNLLKQSSIIPNYFDEKELLSSYVALQKEGFKNTPGILSFTKDRLAFQPLEGYTTERTVLISMQDAVLSEPKSIFSPFKNSIGVEDSTGKEYQWRIGYDQASKIIDFIKV